MKRIETIVHELPAGKYIIADPAYVLSVDDYNDLFKSLQLNNYSGEMIVSRGNNILAFKIPVNNKNREDDCGVLIDKDGFKYRIDNGVLAIISLEVCCDEFLNIAIESNFGRVISSDLSVLCFFDNGAINIGEVFIDNKYKSKVE